MLGVICYLLLMCLKMDVCVLFLCFMVVDGGIGCVVVV